MVCLEQEPIYLFRGNFCYGLDSAFSAHRHSLGRFLKIYSEPPAELRHALKYSI